MSLLFFVLGEIDLDSTIDAMLAAKSSEIFRVWIQPKLPLGQHFFDLAVTANTEMKQKVSRIAFVPASET